MSVAQVVPSQKRKRSSRGVCDGEDDDTPHTSNKRHRVGEVTQEARRAARQRFWDTLSKVWLTPRALQEFDRRNARQQTEGADLRLWPRKRFPVDISQLTATSLKDLKRFARRGGPSLTDVRNCPEPLCLSSETMSSRGSNSRRRKQPSNTPSSSSNGLTLKSSAYDRDFEQNCIDHGIYMPARVPKPDNWVDLQNALSEPRRSLSPSRFTDDDFNRFCDAELAILDEKDVTTDSLPYILGGKQPENPRAQDVLFGKIDDMAPDVFKKPRPDVYWGAPTQQINRQVRQDLSGQIVPSTKPRYPAAPNFFLEVKGPQGTDEVKIRQACYDGAIGSRGMHALQCYGQAEPTYDNMAYAISATYHAGTLKLYSHHPAQPSRPGESPQYHMTPLRGWLLTDTPQTFRQGVGAFRNARDSAREQRDKLIEQANAVAQAQSADSMSFDDSTSQDTITGLGGRLCPSDTSTDGLEVDTDIIVVAVDDPSATPPTKRQKKAEETRQTRSTTRNTRDQQLSQKG